MKLKKIALGIMIVILLQAFMPLISGCSNNKDKTNGGDDISSGSGGIHEFEVIDTDISVITAGKTDYKIVYPDAAARVTLYAVRELQTFFHEATGIELEAVSDSGLTFSRDNKYFCVGPVSFLSEAGVTVDFSTLKDSGIRMVTKGNTVFMTGAAEMGTLCAVYEFLHQMFGFEFYTAGIYDLDKNVSELRLKNFDITDVPDINIRAANYGFMYDDTDNAYRMRLVPHYNDNSIFKIHGVHNTLYLLPKDDYFNNPDESKNHKKWYMLSNDPKQLCYNAQGDAQEYELMIQTITNALKSDLMENPDMRVVGVSQMDVNVWCECPACSESKNKYGTDSAALIQFTNRLSKELYAWFETAEGALYKRDLKLWTLAYHKTVNAPVERGQDGTYMAIDESVVLDEHVAIMYAPASMNFQKSINDPANLWAKDNIEKWASISDNLFLWTYSTNFHNYLLPYNTFNSMQDSYRKYTANNVVFLYDHGQRNNSGLPSGWSLLKAYLNSKLAWNVEYDIKAMTDNFFKAVYGPAADTMSKLFLNYRVHAASIEASPLNYGASNSIYFRGMSKAYWPKPVLTQWVEFCNEALSDISSLLTEDNDLYKLYYKHIVAERVSTVYLLVELHSTSMRLADLNSYKAMFNDDVLTTGISRKAEGAEISLYDLN